MDEAGDERDEADAIWGSSAADPEIVEPTGGRLRRRSGGRQSAQPTDLGPPPASPSVAPGQAAPGGIDDLWVALTAITQRVDHLSEATSAMRTEVSRSLAEISAAVAGGQGQTVQTVQDAISRSHDQVSREVESSSSELRRRFTDDLESVTGSVADALAQVAGQLERLSAAWRESQLSIDALGEEFHAVSSRLDTLEPQPSPDLAPVIDGLADVAGQMQRLSVVSEENGDSIDAIGEGPHAASSRFVTLEPAPPADLSPVTDAMTRVARLVEELSQRIG